MNIPCARIPSTSGTTAAGIADIPLRTARSRCRTAAVQMVAPLPCVLTPAQHTLRLQTMNWSQESVFRGSKRSRSVGDPSASATGAARPVAPAVRRTTLRYWVRAPLPPTRETLPSASCASSPVQTSEICSRAPSTIGLLQGSVMYHIRSCLCVSRLVHSRD